MCLRRERVVRYWERQKDVSFDAQFASRIEQGAWMYLERACCSEQLRTGWMAGDMEFK